ncbi:MAG TPA: hypothetical protein VMS76_06560 [Planctomycetota bacterium]|nr:hypothetical protein [Planctomycetota bacterium]
MLVEFQQAFADLVASPALCRAVRDDASILDRRYELTDRERTRLVGLARHSGMACSCMLYRANRLAPLVMNLPQLCRALGDQLRPILDDYWTTYPNSDVHFVVESHRFCEFVARELRLGRPLPLDVGTAIETEMPPLAMRFEASYTETARRPRE